MDFLKKHLEDLITKSERDVSRAEERMTQIEDVLKRVQQEKHRLEQQIKYMESALSLSVESPAVHTGQRLRPERGIDASIDIESQGPSSSWKRAQIEEFEDDYSDGDKKDEAGVHPHIVILWDLLRSRIQSQIEQAHFNDVFVGNTLRCC